MKIIRRYDVPIRSSFFLDLPNGFAIARIGTKDGEPSIWVLEVKGNTVMRN